jgi:hypothetical protein
MVAMDNEKTLRQHLVWLLEGGHAHTNFESAVSSIPAKLYGVRPKGAEHSPWEILEHMRIAQWDILEFSRSAKHVSPKFPEGYWPGSPKPEGRRWEQSVKLFRGDLAAMIRLVKDRRRDLYASIPWGDGQTILREALLLADHNAYHLGELVLVRRLLRAW